MRKIFYDKKLGWFFPYKYQLLGAIGVLGILYFDHPTIKFIFGIYVFGCLLGWFIWGRHIDKL